MPSMPKGCGFCDRATNESPAWEWKDRIIHLKCFLEFQQFITDNLARSPEIMVAPKRSDETCLHKFTSNEVNDGKRTLVYTLCNSLAVKAATVDDQKYLEAVNKDQEIIYGPIHPACLIIALKAEVLRLYNQYGGI